MICPFCAEEIKDQAKLCRFCGKDLPATVTKTAAEVNTPNTDPVVSGSKMTQQRKLIALAIIVVLLITVSSLAFNKYSEVREEQIALLKANVCKVTKATGKDTVNGQDVSDVLNNGFMPSTLNDPADADFWAAVKKRDVDANKLTELVGEWINPEDGTGWLKFCNS